MTKLLPDIRCPTCDSRLPAKPGLYIHATPWSDDCTCCDMRTCPYHQLGGERPDRPSKEVMIQRARDRCARALRAWRKKRRRFMQPVAQWVAFVDREPAEGWHGLVVWASDGGPTHWLDGVPDPPKEAE